MALTLDTHANNVLQEFGGNIPENLLSYESVKRQFVRVRALELHKLGISDTDKTVVEGTLDVTTRSGAMPSKYQDIGIIPAFVELKPTNATTRREKIEIVPIEQIADFETSYAIAFYGTPMQYKLSFDAWDRGEIYLFYDPVEDWDALVGSDSIVFPPNFLIYLECKTATLLIKQIKFNLTFKKPAEYTDEHIGMILSGLEELLQTKMVELGDWERQMKLWRNKDGNENPRLRRTADELQYSDYRNVTGNQPLDWSF